MLESLDNIYEGKFTHKEDMNQFKGQRELLDKLLSDAQIVLNIQRELVTCGKDILHPKVYEFYLKRWMETIEFIKIERKKFSEAR